MKKITLSSILFLCLVLTSYNVKAQLVVQPYSSGTATTTFGSANTGWSHILTNAPRFYFSKPIAVNNGQFGAYSSSNLSLSTGVSGSSGFGTTRMTVLNSNGNVGIGTTTPQAKLDVNGNMYVNGNIGIGKTTPTAKLDIIGNDNAWPLSIVHNATTDWQVALNIAVDRDLAYPIAIRKTDGVTTEDVFLVRGNGIVNAKKLYAEEVEVRIDAMTVSWPDYVFADNYELSSLAEIEKYIEENNHLPNVPSASKVEEEGVNLGEMDAILLRKIEELTLYIIELEKRIKKVEE